jgi:putative ubiquitin-RnfH superfamily antitoxin RatB of RatAB toxin-antitoxin module
MRIEVVYALPHRQQRIFLDLAPGDTVLDALEASGLTGCVPRIETGDVGVWGRAVGPETPLRDRDRVELYRRLVADPTAARRARAARARL